MVKNKLEEEFMKILEENQRYEEDIRLQRDRLVFLEKEIAEAERKIQQKERADDVLQNQKKELRHREERTPANLEMDTEKFADILQRNKDYREQISHLLKVRNRGEKALRKLNQQLAAQRALLDELESGVSKAFSQKSTAENQILELQKGLEGEMSQFISTKTLLRLSIERDAKLWTFIEKKLQNPALPENKNTNETSDMEEQETGRQSHGTVVDVTGKHDKQLDEQKAEELHDAETEPEVQTLPEEPLKEQNRTAQKTLNELTPAIGDLLDNLHKPMTVTCGNILDCLFILQENVHYLTTSQ